MSTDPLRDVEAEMLQGEALFDALYQIRDELRSGRFEEKQRQARMRAQEHERITQGPGRRRAAVEALITGGATEGERAAARAALHRLDEADDAEAREYQDMLDEEEAAEAGAL